MAYDSSRVTTAKQGTIGAVWRAPKGTTLPTDATTALGTEFVNLGHVSEDGWTVSDSKESTTIKNMDGTDVFSVQTGVTSTIHVKLIEGLNPEVLKTAHGTENVTGTLADGISVTVNTDEPEEFVWVFETILRDGVLKRIVVPDGKVTETGDITYKMDEPVAYDFTITSLADASGNIRYEHMKSA